MNSITTPKAILIKNWHIYFENGQTRRIKNLTYSLSPVDHSSITRKALLRKGAAGHTALAIFSELIGLAARCPQRGLLVEGTGAITSEHIAATTGLALSDVEAGIELLASKEVAWITHVACPKKLIVSGSLRKGRKGRPLQPELVHVDNPHPDSLDLYIEWEYAIVDKGNGPETERRSPAALKKLLESEKDEDRKPKDVACHKKSRVLTRLQSLKNLWHATRISPLQTCPKTWHATFLGLNQARYPLWHATPKALIFKRNP